MRVRISVDGELWFINTRHVPAFGDPPNERVTVPVEAVGVAKRPGTAYFRPLPALFTGTLRCDDCTPRDHLLELNASGYYVYRIAPAQQSAAESAPAADDDIGRWSFDPAAQLLTLAGGREAPVRLRVENSHLLTRLGPGGEPLYPDGESVLNRASACTALEPRLFVGGMLTYFADAALLTECLTGQRWPVALEGDFAAMERAYLDALRKSGAEPGSPLYVTLEATLAQRPVMDGEGLRRTVVAERFIGVWPDERCPAGPSGMVAPR
jgi:copper homeostasis protein (lipoprotein)